MSTQTTYDYLEINKPSIIAAIMAREDVEQGQERPPRRRLGRPVRENGWTQPFDFPQVASWFVFPIFFGVAYVLIGLGIATTMDIEASRSVSTGSNSSNNRNDSSLSAERASSSIPVGAWIAVAVAHFALSVVAFVSAAKTTSSNPMDPSLEPFLARPSEEDCAEEAGRFVQDADAVLCSCLASTKRPPAQNTKQRGVLCCSGGFPGVAQCLSCACIPSDIVLPCSSLLGPGNRGLRHTDLSEGHPRLTRLAENGEEEETYYCPYCRVQVHKTSRHCRICDKCVLDFDHHCKWLNNCIGKRNHAVFVVTVSSLFFLVLSELVIAVMAAVGTDPELNRGWTAQRILGIIYGMPFFLVSFLCLSSLLCSFHPSTVSSFFFFSLFLTPSTSCDHYSLRDLLVFSFCFSTDFSFSPLGAASPHDAIALFTNFPNKTSSVHSISARWNETRQAFSRW